MSTARKPIGPTFPTHTSGLTAYGPNRPIAEPTVHRAAGSAVLKGRATNAFRELGQGAFEKIGDQTEATLPIRDALACIEKLSAEIAELSQAQPGQIVTPNRILVVGGVVILVLLLFLAKWLFFGGQPDQTSKP